MTVSILAVALLGACGADRSPPVPGDEGAPADTRGVDSTAITGRPPSSDSETSSQAQFPIRLEDDAGRIVELAAPPKRIISLVPSATGILLALGERGRLVARTDFELTPGVEDLPSVGGGLNPSMETLVSLEPDLVVRFRAESDPDTPRRLDAAGIPHLAVRPDRIEDVRRNIDLLGRAVGRPARAGALWDSIQTELDRVATAVAGLPRPRVAFLGGNPPTVAGQGTFLHELIEIAGGENAFADSERLYAPVSLEEILRRDLDLILATDEASLPDALRGIPVSRVPLTMLSPGPGVASSARRLAGILHPEQLP